MWVIRPPHGFAIVPALAAWSCCCSRCVCFDTPFGFTEATQLGFVPLLFAMPLVFVPVAIALAMASRGCPSLVSASSRPGRLLMPTEFLFAFGAVAVLALAHAEPRDAGAPLLLAALGGAVLADFIVVTLHHGPARRAPLGGVARPGPT